MLLLGEVSVVKAETGKADLHFQNQALLPAALPKYLNPSLLQVGGEGEGLQGGVP